MAALRFGAARNLEEFRRAPTGQHIEKWVFDETNVSKPFSELKNTHSKVSSCTPNAHF
jgi:hypothetical protein